MARERGNVLFIILIVVALFAALSYAVTTSSRSTGQNASSEQAKISQAVLDTFTAAVNGATTRLTMRGCETIYYTPPSEQVTAGSKECFIFHNDGGQVIYQELGLDSCKLSGGNLATLSVGQTCGNLVYTGNSSGRRLYVMNSDLGYVQWSNSSTSAISTSGSNGKSNTDTLAAAGGYPAASACRLLGAKWYLPAFSELQTLWAVANTGAFSTLFPPNVPYLSSSLQSSYYAYFVTPSTNGYQGYSNINFAFARVICMRQD